MLSRNHFAFPASTPFVEPTTSDTSYSPPLQQASAASTAEEPDGASEHPLRFNIQINSILSNNNSGYQLIEVYPKNRSADSIVKFKAAKKDGDEQFDGYLIFPNEDEEYVGIPGFFARTFALLRKGQAEHPDQLTCFPKILWLYDSDEDLCVLVIMEQTKALARKTKVLPITQNFMDQLKYLGLAPILPLVNSDCFVSSADGKRVLANPLSVEFMRTEQFQIDLNRAVFGLVCLFVTGENVKIETFDKAFRRRLRNAGLETGNINFLETIFENISQAPSQITTLDQLQAELQTASINKSLEDVFRRLNIVRSKNFYTGENLDMYSIVIEGRGDGKRTELPVLEFKVKSLDTAAALIASTVQIDDSVYENLKEKAFNLPPQSLEEGIVFLLETYDVFKILISKNGRIIAATTAGKSNKRFFSSPFTFAIPMRGAYDLFDVPKDVRRIIPLDKRIVSAFASKTRRKDESIAWCIGMPSKPYLDAVKMMMKIYCEVDIVTRSNRWVRLDYFDRFYDFVQQKTFEVKAKMSNKNYL